MQRRTRYWGIGEGGGCAEQGDRTGESRHTEEGGKKETEGPLGRGSFVDNVGFKYMSMGGVTKLNSAPPVPGQEGEGGSDGVSTPITVSLVTDSSGGVLDTTQSDTTNSTDDQSSTASSAVLSDTPIVGSGTGTPSGDEDVDLLAREVAVQSFLKDDNEDAIGDGEGTKDGRQGKDGEDKGEEEMETDEEKRRNVRGAHEAEMGERRMKTRSGKNRGEAGHNGSHRGCEGGRKGGGRV